jgi:hypothetical protein
MFKKIFIILFLFQSLAGSAWAGVDMSMMNNSEKSQMQMMHADMSEMAKGMTCMHSEDGMAQSNNCCVDTCSDVLCLSVHSTTTYTTSLGLTQLNNQLSTSSVGMVDIAFNTRHIQPETPPPSSIA